MLITIYDKNNTKFTYATGAENIEELFAQLEQDDNYTKDELFDSLCKVDDMVIEPETRRQVGDTPLANNEIYLEVELHLEKDDERTQTDDGREYSEAFVTVTSPSHPAGAKKVYISGEHTRVRDILTDSLAAFLGKPNKNSLETMIIQINDAQQEVDLDTQLRSGDKLVFSPRGAGRKGYHTGHEGESGWERMNTSCCGHCTKDNRNSVLFSVISPNGRCVSTQVPRDILNGSGVINVGELKTFCEAMLITDGYCELKVTSLNATSAPEAPWVLEYDSDEIDEIGFHASANVLSLDLTRICDANSEDSSEEGYTEDYDSEAMDQGYEPDTDQPLPDDEDVTSDEPVRLKKIVVTFGTIHCDFTVVTGRTTVEDVMTAKVIQSAFTINNRDLETLDFFIHDNSVYPDKVITDDVEEIVVAPRPGPGQKGKENC